MSGSYTQADVDNWLANYQQDRTGVYLSIAQKTGLDQMLKQASISQFSGQTGLAAMIANATVKVLVGNQYPAEISDFSKVVMASEVALFQARLNSGTSTQITNVDLGFGAKNGWVTLGLGQYFPGNLDIIYEGVIKSKDARLVNPAGMAKNITLGDILTYGTGIAFNPGVTSGYITNEGIQYFSQYLTPQGLALIQEPGFWVGVSSAATVAVTGAQGYNPSDFSDASVWQPHVISVLGNNLTTFTLKDGDGNPLNDKTAYVSYEVPIISDVSNFYNVATAIFDPFHPFKLFAQYYISKYGKDLAAEFLGGDIGAGLSPKHNSAFLLDQGIGALGSPLLMSTTYDSTTGSTVNRIAPPALFLKQVDPVTGAELPPGLVRRYGPAGESIRDYFDRWVEVETQTINGQPVIVKSKAYDGYKGRGKYGVTVEKTYAGDKVISTDIKINNNPVGVDFSDFGGVLGSVLGYRLAGGNQLTGIVYSAALKTLGDNLGDVLDGVIGRQSETQAAKDAFSATGSEFISNLKSAGIGAVSSLLTAELVNVVGLNGFAGQVANTAAGAVIGQVLTNLADLAAGVTKFTEIVNSVPVEKTLTAFSKINPAMIGNAIGGFLGSYLASKIISFNTVGGQIGSAVGAALGGIAVMELAKAGTLLAGPIGAFVGAFLGFVLGGLIGSLFGGTPRSGADSVWDASQQKFVVANVWSKKGGSKDAARSVATAVSETFNGVLAAAGGVLLNPELVQSGNYGMRKKAFVATP